MVIFDKPMAAEGLQSYRYKKHNGGYVMIGAENDFDALTQAKLSITAGEYDFFEGITLKNMQKWNGNAYVNCSA